MQTSGSEPGNKLRENYEQALFQLVMHDAAGREGSCLLEENQKLKALAESRPSEEALRKFTEQLDAHLRKKKADARRKQLPRLLRRMAVAAVAICFVFFTAMTTVQAFRVKVMNIWMEIQPEFTIFRLKEDSIGTSGDNLVVNWTNAYVPTYIPEGYTVGSMSINEPAREIVYTRGDSSIIYTELDASSSPVIDTENASRLETVNINGHTGTLVQKNGVTTIVWDMDGRLFLIQAWTDADTAIKVAEGVKYVK